MARYGYLEEFEKMMATAIFKGVLDITYILTKIVYLKGESSGSLDSNELDIEGLKAASFDELVVRISCSRIYYNRSV